MPVGQGVAANVSVSEGTKDGKGYAYLTNPFTILCIVQ